MLSLLGFGIRRWKGDGWPPRWLRLPGILEDLGRQDLDVAEALPLLYDGNEEPGAPPGKEPQPSEGGEVQAVGRAFPSASGGVSEDGGAGSKSPAGK